MAVLIDEGAAYVTLIICLSSILFILHLFGSTEIQNRHRNIDKIQIKTTEKIVVVVFYSASSLTYWKVGGFYIVEIVL